MSEPAIVTFGCRLNTFESEVIAAHARQAGLSGATIVNTCAVTREAERQAAQTIRRLKRDNPAGRIIVTGCAAQIAPQRFADMPEVDHVIGNAEKLEAETFAQLARPGAARAIVGDIMLARTVSVAKIDGIANRARATIQIQNGCDHRCTFCAIPFGRGNSRSVAANEVVAQARRLVELGIGEIVLTGVDVTSYGTDIGGETTLGQLVRRVLREVPALKRLRLSSIDQVEADAELIAAFAEEERLMPHVHLSLQSGDDLIFEAHEAAPYAGQRGRLCDTLRRLRPDVVFGADLIAGFPTEDDAMFRNSLDLVDDCAITYLHVFPYSPRPGTPAARMPQVAGTAIKDRASRLRAAGARRRAAYFASLHGETVEILMENGASGRTRQFVEIEVGDGERHPAGSFRRVRVDARAGALRGEVVA